MRPPDSQEAYVAFSFPLFHKRFISRRIALYFQYASLGFEFDCFGGLNVHVHFRI